VKPLLLIMAWLIAIVIAVLLLRYVRRSRKLQDRMFRGDDVATAESETEPRGALTHRLSLAGYRSVGAVPTFLLTTGLGLFLGVVAVFAIYRLGLVQSGAKELIKFPGGVGEIFLPMMYAAPWLALLMLAAAPWILVRSARRERVIQFEQDLPLFLELLATLGEAGIGFDAALDRVLDAQRQDRPLTEEFRTFQREVLAGVGRVRSLRRVADRADVLSLTILISALVQAEQVGSGISEVLRRQADDLRNRRRERALALANALPVKLLFPLVICFLPGLFVATLGPTFYQFFQFADAVIQNRGLR